MSSTNRNPIFEAPTQYGALKILKVWYHRNGISGQGFDTVQFIDPDHGTLLAVVLDVEHDRFAGAVCCFVTNPTDATLCYRGDYYADTLRRVIADHQRASDEKALAAMRAANGGAL